MALEIVRQNTNPLLLRNFQIAPITCVSMPFPNGSAWDHSWLVTVIRWNFAGLLQRFYCGEKARVPPSLFTRALSEQNSIGNRYAVL